MELGLERSVCVWSSLLFGDRMLMMMMMVVAVTKVMNLCTYAVVRARALMVVVVVVVFGGMTEMVAGRDGRRSQHGGFGYLDPFLFLLPHTHTHTLSFSLSLSSCAVRKKTNLEGTG